MKASEFITEIRKGQKDANGYTRCWPGKHAEGTKKGRNGGQVRNCVPNESVTEAKQLSIEQLATISDAALDAAYHYGRSQPGNTFGWQANLKSAAFAKQMIDRGITDIEQISNAIHKGWNVTAQAFVKNPMMFDDSKTMAPEKLEAKIAQRQKLMTQQYAQLPEEEKEKDRVVARAMLQAITGQQQSKFDQYQQQRNTPAKNSAEYINRQANAKPGDPVPPPFQKGVAEELTEEFDLIESIIENLALHNGVDAEMIWEDLETLDDDELYVFATTTPVMESQGVAEGSEDKIYDHGYRDGSAGKPMNDKGYDGNAWGSYRAGYLDGKEARKSGVAEDWQKANKKDKTDGMSQKAVNAYRREHPGSKLQTAVTTKPSKLKKGSKASKRRKSYCSRSRGQMKMHNISCAKTPDKAICKARRRWNCE
jgi:hypothetical protein